MRYLFSHQQSPLCLCLAAEKVTSMEIRLTLVSEAEAKQARKNGAKKAIQKYVFY